MKIKIYKRKTFQYFMLYLFYIMHGSLLYKSNLELCLYLAFAISSFYLLRNIKKYNKNVLYGLAALFAVLILVYVSTEGSLSLFSILCILLSIIFPYTVYIYDKTNFLPRFVNLSVFLCAIGLLFYLISLISPSTIMAIFNRNTHIAGNYYGGLFFTYDAGNGYYTIARYLGVFTEPGVFQILICANLYILLFLEHSVELETKKKNFYIAIFMLSLIFAQSTSGYFSFAILVIGYLLRKGEKQNRTLKFIFVAIISIFAYLFLFKQDSIISSSIMNKIINKNGEIDLKTNTGAARIISMQVDLAIALEYPFGAGFGTYNNMWDSIDTSITSDSSSCVGLTKYIATIGVVPTLAIIIGLLKVAWANRNSVLAYVTFVCVYINTMLGQPNILYPVFVAIVFIQSRSSIAEIIRDK